MSAPPRNGPCPCDSGVKYKKCCLPKDEAARAAPPRRVHAVDHRGTSFAVTGNPSRETLDLAVDYFARKDADEGWAAQVARFSQPLIDAAGDNPVAVENAMTLGALLWNVAVAGEDPDVALADAMKGMSLSDEAAAEFRAIAAGMVERHKQMFPALHADRGERCASTEG
ncbi:MAG TPA: SEC-C metal-binding domain-containing protein [Anaeromyxobacteraceae bacterium]|nr:SEC-C metal-binding domain-containing protein [Anaeromyxobacteraceae bacterium]